MPTRLALALIFLAGHLASMPAATARKKEDMEAATRLQVFLDRASFSPGKLDGRYGEFTQKALALYRESRGEKASPPPKDKTRKDAAPDVSGIDLGSINPVFVNYVVTPEDMAMVGDLAPTVALQAKQKSLPYKDAAEAIAEKFHCDVDFLAELNPGKTKGLKAGDELSVPNVEPFDLAKVKDITPGSEIAPVVANEIEDKASTAKSEEAPPSTSVAVDVKAGMLQVKEGDKLVAAYPVTVGSSHTESPVGDWKVKGVAKMPNFRYDKQMLNHGERSSDFHMLPPGPNNPVGVMWIQLNKKGIGVHGTDDPDSIGRSASHGCVRLANWDVVRLAAKVKGGVPVSIH